MELEMAEQSFRSLISREPRNRAFQADLGRVYTRLGLARRLQKDLRGSNDAFRLSAEIWQRITELDPANMNARRDIALAEKNMAENYLDLGDRAKAKEYYESSIRRLTELRGQKALPEIDNKLIAELESAFARL